MHSAVTFSPAFDGDEDARAPLVQFSGIAGYDYQTLEGEAARRLLEWSESQQVVFKRQKRMAACDMEYNLFAPKPFCTNTQLLFSSLS